MLIRRRLQWTFVLGTLVAILGCMAVQQSVLHSPAATQHLLAARERWERNPLSHYTMRVEYESTHLTCTQEVEVRDEQVVEISRNTCSSPLPPGAPDLEGWTVTRLFERIEKYIGQYEGTCGPRGCACNGPVRVQTRYDEARGYPRSIEIRSNSEERWLFSGGSLFEGNCGSFAFKGDRIEVVSIVAIP